MKTRRLIRKISGWFILFSPIIILFIAVGLSSGWDVALLMLVIICAAATAGAACVVIGTMLIHSD